MQTAILIAILTIIFLLVKIKHRIKLLLISVFILPFLYAYFGILPNSIKIIIDIYLFLFLIEIIFKNKLFKVLKLNNITKFTAIYIVGFTVIFIISSLLNRSNLILSLLEYRKIIYNF